MQRPLTLVLAPWAFLIALLALSPSSTPTPPPTTPLNGNTLLNSKPRLAHHDPALQPAFQQLLKDAQTALQAKPTSVMDKPAVAASGDKHDYASFAPYYWPNPDTK